MYETHDGKSVVITGASSGIGNACALRLDKLGLRVFAGVRKDADAASLKQKASERLRPLLIDVTIPESIESARDTVSAAVQPDGLFALVNNAGIALGGPLEFLPLDDIRKSLEVNLIGAIAMTQAFLPLLRTRGGRIVNMSSVSGLIALPFLSPYAASKFALEAVTDSLRVELRPWGISVSMVEPGDVATPIWEKSLAVMDEVVKKFPPRALELYGPVRDMRERFKPHGIPPDQVARLVEHALFARSPKARYLVGLDARILALIRRLPAGIRDWLIARQLPSYG